MTEAESLQLKAKARRRRAEAQGGPPSREWSDVPGEALQNAPASAWNAATTFAGAVPGMVMDATPLGLMRKMSGYVQDPEKASNEATGIFNFYKNRYGSEEALKNTIATDPVGFAGDASVVLSGPFAMAGRGPLASRAAASIPGQTRLSQALLRKAAPKTSDELAALGPDAMLLDASPSMTGLAQGASIAPGASKDAIVNALLDRQNKRVPRLDRDRKAAFGPARDPELLKKQIDEEAMQQAGPIYSAAKENAPELYGQLDDLLAQQLTHPSAGMSLEGRGVMSKIMTEIDDALAAGDPSLTAERLHSIRQNLDAKIVYDNQDLRALSSADKAAQSQLKQARAAVDDILKNRLGFGDADEIVSKAKRAQSDIDYGQSALEGGKYAHTPERFRLELNKRDPKMVGEGMKADIRNAVGTQANDLSALRKKLGGDNDFNRDKLIKVFGREPVEKLVKAIDRETLFSQNYADVARNSQTAMRTAAERDINKSEASTFTGSETATGLTIKGTAKLVNSIVGKIATRASQPTRDALTNSLIKKGPDAVKLLDELIKATPNGGIGRKLLQAFIASGAANAVNRPHR